jgi:hypothetical protein
VGLGWLVLADAKLMNVGINICIYYAVMNILN